MTAEAARGSVPPELEEYRIVRLLGQGGMGQVYLAEDRLLARLVAIKIIASPSPAPAARARFFVEARAVARLSHPNVVAVYRVGELRRQPFLVSEFVRGQSLAELAKPVSWRRALEIGVGLSRGLAAAHRRGVLHRDIKPANAMISEDGTVKLLDFGLAELSSEVTPSAVPGARPDVPATAPRTFLAGDADTTATDPGAPASERSSLPAATAAPDPSSTAPPASVQRAAGTPRYMAPELWRGATASPHSDVYAVGVVLHELCTGAPPFGRLDLAARLVALSEGEPPPLLAIEPSVDPRLAAIVDRCLRRDPDRRFRDGDALREALEQIAVPAAPHEALPAGNPYRGLLAFEAEHRGLFFGRSAEILGIVDRLRADPRVLVVGDSGTGKSSLCRAGVLPAVAAGALGPAAAAVHVALGSHPFAALVGALAPLAGGGEARLAARLRADPAAVARALREIGTVVLFVDQLEELCTLAAADEAAATAEALHALTASGVRLLGTVRSDFLTRLSALPGLGDDLPAAIFLLRALTADRLREAVLGPAAAKGVSFESEAIVDTLVREARCADGGLPLLQFALGELWDKRDEARGIIPTSALAAIGGVVGALARHADEVLEGMPGQHRRAARAVLLSLVTAEGTRARRPEAELLATVGPGAPAALAGLVRGRLLVACATDGGEGSAYAIAHEALLSGWDTLRGWLGHDVEGRALRQRMERAAGEWERLGRSADALWGDRLLVEAAGIEISSLGPREAEFLGASRRRVRARRRLGTIVAVSAAVLFAALGLYSYGEKRHADEQASLARAAESKAHQNERDAQQQARKARDVARVAVAGRPEVGATVAALTLREVEEAPAQVPGWLAAVPFSSRTYLTQRVLKDGNRPYRAAAWSPDGLQIVTGAADGTVRVWTSGGTPRGDAWRHGDHGALTSLAWSPDGSWILTAGNDGFARIWKAGEEPRGPTRELSHGAPIGAAAWSPDGSRIVTAGLDGIARVWAAFGGEREIELRAALPLHAVAWSPDGAQIVAGSDDGTARVWKDDGANRGWTAHAMLPVTPPEHADPVHAVAWSPDGTQVVTGTLNHHVLAWSADGAHRTFLGRHTGAIESVVWSAAGILSASLDGTVRVWSRDGTPVATLAGHTHPVMSVAVSPAGPEILTASFDGKVRVWREEDRLVRVLSRDTATRQLEADVPPSSADKLPGPRLSPDGKWVVTVTTAHLAEIGNAGARGAKVATLAGHTNRIQRVAWSADGGRLVSASLDRTARVWGIDGSLLAVLEHEGEVHDAWFSDEGNIVTASGKGTASDWTVREWTLDPDRIQRALWLSTPHCLDAEELRRLLGASNPASDALHLACEHMSSCLRDVRGRPVESRYVECLAAFREEQAQAER